MTPVATGTAPDPVLVAVEVDVDVNDPVFAGHYPGFPILPGLFLVEHVNTAYRDHVAALGWCLSQGFRGRLVMTPQTRRDTAESMAGYATPAEQALVARATIEALPVGADFDLGPLRITPGRSGHMAGGVWCSIADSRVSLDVIANGIDAALQPERQAVTRRVDCLDDLVQFIACKADDVEDGAEILLIQLA